MPTRPRKRFSELPESHKLGRIAELRIAALFDNHGREVHRCTAYNSPYDLIVDGWFVDVKCCRMFMAKGVPTWVFSIMRHGRKVETADFYVFRLQDIPFMKRTPIHLLFKAPIGNPNVVLTWRSILANHAWKASDFQDFAAGKYGRKAIAA